MGEILSVKDWQKSHSKNQYMLFNTSGRKEGEGEKIAFSNNPAAFSGFIQELKEKDQTYVVVQGEL